MFNFIFNSTRSFLFIVFPKIMSPTAYASALQFLLRKYNKKSASHYHNERRKYLKKQNFMHLPRLTAGAGGIY